MPQVSAALSRRKWRKAWRAMAKLRRDYMVYALGSDRSANWSAIEARFEGPRQAMLAAEGYKESGLVVGPRLWSNDYLTVEVEEGGIPSDHVLADWYDDSEVV